MSVNSLSSAINSFISKVQTDIEVFEKPFRCNNKEYLDSLCDQFGTEAVGNELVKQLQEKGLCDDNWY